MKLAPKKKDSAIKPLLKPKKLRLERKSFNETDPSAELIPIVKK